MLIQKIARLRTRTPALEDLDNTPLRSVVAADAAAANAPTPERATPAVAASAPLGRSFDMMYVTAWSSVPLNSSGPGETDMARVSLIVLWYGRASVTRHGSVFHFIRNGFPVTNQRTITFPKLIEHRAVVGKAFIAVAQDGTLCFPSADIFFP